MSQKTTFEHMGEVLKVSKPPSVPIITVKRNTTSSKYQFYQLARVYAKRTGVTPKFFTFERQKSFADQIKGIIEEHSVFNAFEKRLFVLEGFYNKWVQGLVPAPNTFIVAETDGGELAPVDFTQRMIRDQLRILMDLGDMRRPDFTLRGLVGMDWSSLQSFEEIETLLNKANVMRWSEDDVRKELTSSEWNNALTVIKRGTTKELMGFLGKVSHTWFLSRVTKNLADLIHYRSLRAMGHEHEPAVKSMDLHPRSLRARELEEVNQMYTAEDVVKIAERLIDLDFLILKNPALGTEIMALNSPTRLRK